MLDSRGLFTAEAGHYPGRYLVDTRVRVVPLKERRPVRLLHAVCAHADSPALILKLVYGKLSY